MFRTNVNLQFFDVPVTGRTRATLRVYAAAPTAVAVTIDDIGLHDLQLRPGADEFDPAYAEMTLPFGGAAVSITPRGNVPVWAFISLTNNETQMVTTITPQR